jgi:hypothetical protein
MPRTPSLRSLFLCWVCFSVAFITVFQAFLTTFLIDSGYKTPIQNMDELLASGIKLHYHKHYNLIFEVDNQTEKAKIKRNRVICPNDLECIYWVFYHKNISFFMSDLSAEINIDYAYSLGKSSKPWFCRLQNGMAYNKGLRMVMMKGDPLLTGVSETLDRVVEAGFYNFWVSFNRHVSKITFRKIAFDHNLDGYYSFNLYHLQPAFYLLLVGYCLNALCFIFELLHNRPINKTK